MLGHTRNIADPIAEPRATVAPGSGDSNIQFRKPIYRQDEHHKLPTRISFEATHLNQALTFAQELLRCNIRFTPTKSSRHMDRLFPGKTIHCRGAIVSDLSPSQQSAIINTTDNGPSNDPWCQRIDSLA